MFGFMRRKNPEGFKDLPEVRDCLKSMVGESVDVHVGTVVGHLLDIGGKTPGDVEKAKGMMLACLQKYVRAEILLDRQNRGHEPSLAELAGLRMD